MSKLKILWISPKWCSPAIDGARVATEGLLTGVPKSSIDLDFVCLGSAQEQPVPSREMRNLPIKKLFFFQRKLPVTTLKKCLYYGARGALKPGRALTFTSYNDNELKGYIQDLIEDYGYDWVVFDGLHLAALYYSNNEFNPPEGAKLVYRAHNIESELWRQSSLNSNNPFFKAFFKYQYRRVKEFEKKVIDRCEIVSAISPEDLEWMKANSKNENLDLSLLGIRFEKEMCPQKAEKTRLLFLGKMDWAPNKDGLKWFLEKVWPKLDKTKFELIIAGSGNAKWLNEYKKLNGIIMKGFVEDIGELYRSCDLTIAPLFYGSGTRIKVVESYARGKVCLTTKLGAQGTGLSKGTDYLHSTSAKEWVDTIESFDREEAYKMVLKARKKLMKSYDRKVVAQKFYERLV